MTSAPDSDNVGLQPPAFADIADAARRLAGRAVITPLHENAALNETLGGRILVKCENLQRTGSFKFRGAYNFISRLDDEAREIGVVSYSSGNHAQGVAAAARLMGVPAMIVMPDDAPAIKLANTRALGADIRTYDRASESREEIAQGIAQERGAVILPPFDHPHTIAGQGTVGLELARQADEAGAKLDAVVCPCSGGGLVAGVALALAELSPGTEVYAGEPAGFDDTARSLAAGERLANAAGAHSICDALLSPTPGRLTFAVNRRLLAGGVAVSDDDVRAAMAYGFRTLKLVAEPGGAAALAAALCGKLDCRGRTVAVVLSGGNVDPRTFADALDAR